MAPAENSLMRAASNVPVPSRPAVPARGGSLPARAEPGPGLLASFVGRGISFPMAVDRDGSVRLTRGTENLDASVRVILSTAPGERLMRPQFGCQIWDLLFEPVNSNTLGLMDQAVRDAILQWEPRVDVTDVECVPDASDSSLVHIRISYQVRDTNDRRNLVYPFYVIPREEP